VAVVLGVAALGLRLACDGPYASGATGGGHATVAARCGAPRHPAALVRSARPCAVRRRAST